MEGVAAYDASAFHTECDDVDVKEIGGFAFLWCKKCKILCNLQAVAPKFQTYQEARESGGKAGPPLRNVQAISEQVKQARRDAIIPKQVSPEEVKELGKRSLSGGRG